MTPTVKKTHRDDPVVTLLGRIDNGAYAAQKMHADDVSYARYWKSAHDQMMVIFVPDDAQLRATLHSQDEGKLGCDTLQDYCSAANRISILPLAFAGTFVQRK